MKLDICQLMEDAKLFFNSLICVMKNEILTTNVNFKSWDEIFQDPKIANAILVVLHHATVVSIVGQSYRIKDHFSKEND